MGTIEDNPDVNFNVYVGSELGIMKGVCFGTTETPILKNFRPTGELQTAIGICDISWSDWDTRKDLIVAFSNGIVKGYNTKLRAFTQEMDLDLGESPFVSLRKFESNYLVGQESGDISLWNFSEAKTTLKIQTGEHLAKFRQCPTDQSIVASGGKENDLKIYNLNSEQPDVPIFIAKNVPHVYELRVPIWVQDIAFLPQTTDLIATTSRYGFLRLYDTKVSENKNRPVIDMKFCDHPLMSISPTRNVSQVLVGSAQGKVGLVDLRNYGGKEKVVHLFHGFNGSVRSIAADENSPYFVSCGLDRHLYLHHLNQKAPIKKLYLRSRLTCAAITNNFLGESTEEDEVKSSWLNVDMTVLPGVLPTIETPPAKKRKKIYTTLEDSS